MSHRLVALGRDSVSSRPIRTFKVHASRLIAGHSAVGQFALPGARSELAEIVELVQKMRREVESVAPVGWLVRADEIPCGRRADHLATGGWSSCRTS